MAIMAAVAVAAASGGYFVARLFNPAADLAGVPTPTNTIAEAVPDELLGHRRPDFTLADATGRVVSADAFDGKILLVNFWATWCEPCVEEMPMLSRLQEDYAGRGIAVVGVALDDPQRAREFAGELQLGYPILFGLPDAMLLGRRYGNTSGMLPYSVLVDAAGFIRWTRLGALDRAQLEAQLALLQPARG